QYERSHVPYASSFVAIATVTVLDTGLYCCDGEGVYIGSGSGTQDNTNNVTIKNSTIYSVTDEGIELKPGSHDCTVDGNTIYNANKNGDNGYGGAAIEVNESSVSGNSWPSNPNHLIRNNIVHNIGNNTGGALFNTGIRLGTGSTV